MSVAEILGRGPRGQRDGLGVRSLILTYIRQNSNGVTAQLVAQAARISESWAKRLLEELCAQREIYDRKMQGFRGILYYPNGKLVHKYLQEAREFGSQIFRVSVHEGTRQPRIQIQERQFTLLDGEKVEGSIFVDLDNAPKLLAFIQDMLTRLNEIEEAKRIVTQ